MPASAECNISPRTFQRISQVVQQHCGINLHEGKLELVQARLAKMVRTGPFNTPEELVDHALSNPDSGAFGELIDALSTNLTSFFRESAHFTYLAETFLPELIRRKKASGEKSIRAWSAASSTGEEPYTLAMVLLDTLQSHHADFDAKILATDISHRVLRIAKKGVYDRQRIVPVPPQLRSRYLHSAPDGELQVSSKLRDTVCFAHLNLMESWPFAGPLDFIFCRNVMIYFEKPTQEQLVNRFHGVLAPGGLLFTGHCESLTGVNHPFRHLKTTIYQKA